MAQPGYPNNGKSSGTPKIVPVLVSIGVAVGTFCGLYFGLGTKQDEAAADTGSEVAQADKPEAGSAAAGGSGSGSSEGSGSAVEPAGGSGSGSVAEPTAGSGSGSVADPAAGSGSGSVAEPTAGSGSGSATDPAAGSGSGSGAAVATGAGSGAAPPTGDGAGGGAEPTVRDATVQFSVTPANAEVTIDGKPVENSVATVVLVKGTRTIKVTAKASGYRSFDKKFTVTDDQIISFKMTKRGGGSGGNTGRNNTGDKIDLGKIDM